MFLIALLSFLAGAGTVIFFADSRIGGAAGPSAPVDFRFFSRRLKSEPVNDEK